MCIPLNSKTSARFLSVFVFVLCTDLGPGMQLTAQPLPPASVPAIPDPVLEKFARAEQLSVSAFPEQALDLYRDLLRDKSLVAEQRAQALLRLARTHQLLGQDPEAVKVWEQLILESPSPVETADAAIQLATHHELQGRPLEASRLLAVAFDNAGSAAERLALCRKAIGIAAQADLKDMEIRWHERVDLFTKNAIEKTRARLALGRLLTEAHRPAEALEISLTLLNSTYPSVRAQANANAAFASQALRDPGGVIAFSLASLREPFDFPRRIPLLRLLVQRWQEDGQHRELIHSLEPGQGKPRFAIPEASIPFVLLACARSRIALDEEAEALQLLDQLVRLYPRSAEARDAGLQRLVMQYRRDPPDFEAQILAFLETNPGQVQAAGARLLLAEHAYRKGQWQQAAEGFLIWPKADLLETQAAGLRLRMSWAQWMSGQSDLANVSLAEFVAAYPHHEAVPWALALRGVILHRSGDEAAARILFGDLFLRYPQHREGKRLAGEELARIALAEGDYHGLLRYAQPLATEYPEDRVRFEAASWCGVALLRLGHAGQAIPFLDSALQTQDEVLKARVVPWLAAALFHAGVKERLPEVAAKVIFTDPPPRLPPALLLESAAQAHAAGNLELAKQFLTHLQQQMDLPGVRLRLAFCEWAAGDFKAAGETINSLREMPEFANESMEFLACTAYVEALIQRSVDGSPFDFQALLRAMDASSEPARWRVAAVLDIAKEAMDQGESAMAVEILKAALQRDEDPVLRLIHLEWLAKAYDQAGDSGAAVLARSERALYLAVIDNSKISLQLAHFPKLILSGSPPVAVEVAAESTVTNPDSPPIKSRKNRNARTGL